MGETELEVFGMYATATSAEIALDRLIAAGYSRENVSLLMTDAYATREGALGGNHRAHHGVTTSSLVGGTLGSLGGIDSVVVSGIGPVIAAGRILRLLQANANAGAAHALVGMGVPEHEAKRCEDRVRDGEVLLAVDCAQLADTHRAKTVLRESGGDGVAVWGAMSLRWRGFDRDTRFTGRPQPEMGTL